MIARSSEAVDVAADRDRVPEHMAPDDQVAPDHGGPIHGDVPLDDYVLAHGGELVVVCFGRRGRRRLDPFGLPKLPDQGS